MPPQTPILLTITTLPTTSTTLTLVVILTPPPLPPYNLSVWRVSLFTHMMEMEGHVDRCKHTVVRDHNSRTINNSNIIQDNNITNNNNKEATNTTSLPPFSYKCVSDMCIKLNVFSLTGII